MRKLLFLLLLLASVLTAQTGVKLVDGNSTELQLAASGKAYDSGITTLPATSTAVTAVSTKVQTIFCANISEAAKTVTITDNQASPKTYLNAVSVAANGVVMINFGTIGLNFASGIKWAASEAAAINCQIVGAQ